MNTQSERVIGRRQNSVFGLAYLRRLAAWVELKRETYRTRRRETEAREALKAMSPELLDDIGVALDATGDPVIKFASQNPHVIAAEVLGQPARYHDPS